jgi:Tfp pilus assembly protein PilO
MFKYILPIILIGIAIAGFFILTSPLYNSISLEREQIASYDEALDNSKALEAQRDRLTQKYNSFDPEDLSKLQKLLPDNVDNIRLILEIEKIALPYGMKIKDIKYDTTSNNDTTPEMAGVAQNGGAVSLNKNYGIWNLEFSTQGTYNNFINFLKDLENNLRIVDISSIQFSSNASMGLNPSLPEAYKYDLAIKTYWLKN